MKHTPLNYGDGGGIEICGQRPTKNEPSEYKNQQEKRQKI